MTVLVLVAVVHPSPTRSAVFNPGRTSRINVAHFMADLVSLSFPPWNSVRKCLGDVFHGCFKKNLKKRQNHNSTVFV